MLAALLTPFAAWIAWVSSSHRSGYEVAQLASAPAIESTTTEIVIDNLGAVYFPASFTPEQIQAEIKRRFTAATNPAAFAKEPGKYSIAAFASAIRTKQRSGDSRLDEYVSLEDTLLAETVLRKYPEYESQVSFRRYQVVPHFEKRPGWTLAVTAAFAAALLIVLHGVISLVAWVIGGFRAPAA